MTFSEFGTIISNHIGNGAKKGDFVKTLFQQIIIVNGEDNPLDDYEAPAYRAFLRNDRGISKLARSIMDILEPECFVKYLNDICSDEQAANLTYSFSEKGYLVNLKTFAEDIADIFWQIILDAAGEVDPSEAERRAYFIQLTQKFYKIKTLLYTSEPKPIYDFYVPNDLYVNDRGYQTKRIAASDLLLSFQKNFIVITGTGGLGKTMLMHHLVLTMVKDYRYYAKLPIVLYLREFNKDCTDFLAFIQERVPISNLTEYMENGSCVFLLDGMDEMKYEDIKLFEKRLSEMADKYPKNYYIMSSRPISNFISLNRFTTYSLAPFTKEQALEMIDRVVYRPETPELKANFKEALSENMFAEHRDFVEIPLLLTIMLMTYERHKRVPSKRHIFYREAFDTLVDKHDSTKIGYNRAYRTGMFPHEFIMVLEEFCTISYFSEKYSLTDEQFNKAFENIECLPNIHKPIHCADLKTDLTTNLCLMYYDGGKYHYIHRTFQEYFCALHLSQSSDSDYQGVWQFFEKNKNKAAEDYTFDMLYDMKPVRAEKSIFIPFLEDLFKKCAADDPTEEYWNFLELMYPTIYYTDGEVQYYYDNVPASYIYRSIVKKLLQDRSVISKGVPYDERFENEKYLLIEENGEEHIIPADEYVGDEEYEVIDIAGYNCGFKVSEVRDECSDVHDAVESADFPLMVEYREMKRILAEMKARTRKVPTTKWGILN